MAGMFGISKVESTLGRADDGTWLAGLQDMSTRDLARGLKRLLDSGKEWPPSLPEFRKMCQRTEQEKLPMYRLLTRDKPKPRDMERQRELKAKAMAVLK